MLGVEGVVEDVEGAGEDTTGKENRREGGGMEETRR